MTVRLPETAAVLAVRRGVREWVTARGGRMPVVVGLSGGADSLALLAAAVVEAGDVTAVVVDHQLQPGSGEVAAGAAAQALALGCIDAVVVPVEVGRNGGAEAAARAARYAALESVRAGRPVLLGHTLDDQAETVLLGLARGSGGRSIQGMAAWNEPWGRPLLGVRRAQTRQMCADLGIEPWEDPHNLDPAYTRVRVRTEVLPLLEAVLGGGVAQALARTADQLRDDGEVLDALAADLLRAARSCGEGTRAQPGRGRADGSREAVAAGEPGSCRPPGTGAPSETTGGSGPADTDRPTLSIEILATAPAALRRRTIRAWLAEQGVSGLLNAHLQAIDELVSDWRGQGGVAVAGGGRDHRLVVAREHGTLTVRAQPRLDAT
ncbi:tRNA(Ile)-lysidine synthase [Nocardia neocaledoniensis NBRC 108232]|uniref:tRNA(Ile)-lysidine synthase n=1 Tax=Nocardia neocaledoniensis TaxID=236511 RepID=A0A317N229_9NOCA|nr:tRNA lysidine(34) synthetase TilS [Nocardia neocaledoniensis]PWV67916.1 tRNA(Ile)-lysidine synthase [Nocardia neocaledoniensis]GEM33970.1 tRNA(Ile)-lysidine synthase [Nocardia neocaledoniensis NBRC 108232]